MELGQLRKLLPPRDLFFFTGFYKLSHTVSYILNQQDEKKKKVKNKQIKNVFLNYLQSAQESFWL